MLKHKLTADDDWFVKQNRIDINTRTRFEVGHEVVVCSKHHVMLADYYEGCCSSTGCESTKLIPFCKKNVEPALRITPNMTITFPDRPTITIYTREKISLWPLSFLIYVLLLLFIVGGLSEKIIMPPHHVRRIILLMLSSIQLVIFFISTTSKKIRETCSEVCLFGIAALIVFLQQSYYPNILSVPINKISGDNNLPTFVYYDKGFLGMYRTTGLTKREYSDWTYEGEIVNNERHGYGKIYYSNGSTFEGIFVNGERNGQGKWTAADGTKIECNYSNDMRNGYGRVRYTDGQIEEGNFTDGDRNGMFKITQPYGTVFEVEYINGERIDQ